jgi:2-polyprenyl-3-methyl-5-hydroxy-6-metoxy-1,4-benzoquinol methylase
VFDAVWREKRASREELGHVWGKNLRVDEATRRLRRGFGLLDIGCGTGALGVAMRGRFEEIHGLDIAEEAVRLATANGMQARRVDLNRDDIPFGDGTFDAVTILSVLPYVYDPRWVLRECHRVLRDGGELALSVPNMRGLGKLFKQFVRGRFPATSVGCEQGYDGGALHYFCGANIRDLLVEAGFHITLHKGIFCRPKMVEGWSDCLPVWGWLKAEFLAGESFFVCVK